MDLLLAIQKYCDKLIEYGVYPKTKKPSLGKLEKMADLCYAGKYRKLSRYIPDAIEEEKKNILLALMEEIKEIVKRDKKGETIDEEN